MRAGSGRELLHRTPAATPPRSRTQRRSSLSVSPLGVPRARRALVLVRHRGQHGGDERRHSPPPVQASVADGRHWVALVGHRRRAAAGTALPPPPPTSVWASSVTSRATLPSAPAVTAERAGEGRGARVRFVCQGMAGSASPSSRGHVRRHREPLRRPARRACRRRRRAGRRARARARPPSARRAPRRGRTASRPPSARRSPAPFAGAACGRGAALSRYAAACPAQRVARPPRGRRGWGRARGGRRAWPRCRSPSWLVAPRWT